MHFLLQHRWSACGEGVESCDSVEGQLDVAGDRQRDGGAAQDLKQMPIREQIRHKVCVQGENCELRHAQQILASQTLEGLQ